MVKVTHKRKSNNNKQGVILITVLFILAVAMIFIATAILMTNGTRTRVYNRAESNQARLTVTSVAETFYAAMQMQEITDADVEELANKDKTINITSTEGIPGLGGVADNQTTASFSWADDTTIQVKFVTTIDGHSDNVVMKLSFEERIDPPNTFIHQVEVYGGGKLWELEVGKGGEGKADNTIMSHGDAGTSRGSTIYWSTYIETGIFQPGSGTEFHSDVVFLGEGASAGLRLPNYEHPEWGDQIINGKCFTLYDNANMYFIGNNSPTTGSVSMDWLFGDSSTAYYNKNGGDLEAYKTSGHIKTALVKAVNTSTVPKWNTYSGYSTTLSMDNWAEVSAAYKLDSTCPASAVTLNDTMHDLPKGTYKIDGSLNLSSGNITCDLSSGDYKFYITNDCTISKGFIEFKGSGHKAYFIIASGKKLTIAPNASGGSEDFCGIIDLNCYDTTTHTIKTGVVPNVFIFGAGTGVDAEENLSKILSDPEGKHAQINLYGNGKDGKPNAVITALCGLYRGSTSSNDYGSMTSKNSTGNAFYGRVAAYSVYNIGGGKLNMPYCPAPTKEKDSDTYYRELTEYHIISMEYYT